MKKIIIVIVSILVLFIAALWLVPVFFKGDILRLIERQSSKYIQSDLEIKDVRLSMFKSFPHLHVAISDIMISSEEEGKRDTLIRVPLFEASVNLKSFLSGEAIVVNRVLVKDGVVKPKINASGKANWDILVPSEAVEKAAPAPSEDSTDRPIRFDEILVKNLFLYYHDAEMGLHATMKDIDLNVTGDFTLQHTVLNVLMELNGITVAMGDIVWLNNMKLTGDAEIGADLENFVFEFRKSALLLNDLKLDLTGSVGVGEDSYLLDLALNAPDTRFESILALLPADMLKEMEGIKTTGGFQLSMSTKGEYSDNQIPGFDIHFNINDASLKFPESPETVKDINLNLHVTNPGGTISATEADLSLLSFRVANNPFQMKFHLSNLDDPTFKGEVNGVINFENLKEALPLEEMTLNGSLTASLNFDGKYQYIEKEQYEKITANGKLSARNILFKNSSFPEGISIPNGELTVTPQRLDLKNIQVGIYSSDMALQGYVTNYLPYFLRNQPLRGNFTFTSNKLNLNEFMTDSIAEVASDTPTSTGVIEIPKNLDLALNATIRTLLYDDLTVKNITGKVQLNKGVATLQNLGMDLLKGKIIMNGAYNTTTPKSPSVDLNFRADSIDIQESYHAFSFIRESLPIAMDCNGKISTVMNFKAKLDEEMSPIMSTANGGGYITTSGLLINENPTMNKLSDLLKNEELSRLTISQLKINFKIENGNIVVEPFTTKLANQPTTMSGSQTADGHLDYTISMNVDRAYFGKEIEKVLAPIPGSSNIKNLDVDVKIGGTLSSPTVSPDLSKAMKSIEKAAASEVKDNLLKGLDKLLKKE